MSELDREIRDSRLLEILLPGDDLRHQQAVSRTIDEAGRLSRDALLPHLTPDRMDWSTIDGRPLRTARSGTIYLIWAHANTAPTSTCTISFTIETKQQGASPLGSVTIAPGQNIGEIEMGQPVPAGAYLNPTVTTAGGASGVSVGVLIKAG